MPPSEEFAGCSRHTTLESGLEGVDVIMVLRIQKERMGQVDLPDADRYFSMYGLNPERLELARPDAIVFEPAGGTAFPQVARAAAAADIGSDLSQCLV